MSALPAIPDALPFPAATGLRGSAEGVSIGFEAAGFESEVHERDGRLSFVARRLQWGKRVVTAGAGVGVAALVAMSVPEATSLLYVGGAILGAVLPRSYWIEGMSESGKVYFVLRSVGVFGRPDAVRARLRFYLGAKEPL